MFRLVVAGTALSAWAAAQDQAWGVLPPLQVTATKTQVTVGEVPASIAVIPSQELADAGDGSLDDVFRRVANVHRINLGTHTSYPVIRGICGWSDESPAAILVDGTAPRTLALDSILDVEQVEILRGPQGTLHGRNSIPGVVVVTTRAPGSHWTGDARVSGSRSASNQGTTGSASLAAGGPVVAGSDGEGGVGLRLAAGGETSAGWRTNILIDDERAAERRDVQAQGKLIWDLPAGWDLTFSGRGLRNRTTGDQYAPLALAEHHETSNSESGECSNRLVSGTLELGQQTGDRHLTALTGASSGRDVFALDIDFTALPGNFLEKTTDNRQLSQELRYGGGRGLRSWLIGVFAARDSQDVDYRQTITPGLDPLLPSVNRSQVESTQIQQEVAVFGEAGIPLGPGWTVTLGLRAGQVITAVELTATSNLFPGYDYDDSLSDPELLPKAALSYAWNEDILTWLSTSRGFRAGGFNLTPNSLAEVTGGYDAETAWTYEVGQRIASLDRTLQLSFAGFRTDYRDKQVTILEPPSTYLIRNAAEATIVGVEADLRARVGGGVELLAGVGTLRATFASYQADAATSLDGNHLPMAPSYDSYAGAQWRHESGFVARLDLTAIGAYYADDRNLVSQESYQQLGARVGYETEDWALYLWGRNLTDAVYLTRGSVSPSAGPIGVTGEPRTLGVTGEGKF
jgi:iron complex outermembrane receptor protein